MSLLGFPDFKLASLHLVMTVRILKANPSFLPDAHMWRLVFLWNLDSHRISCRKIWTSSNLFGLLDLMMPKCLGYKNYKAKQYGSRKAKNKLEELNFSEDHEGLFVCQLDLKDRMSSLLSQSQPRYRLKLVDKHSKQEYYYTPAELMIWGIADTCLSFIWSYAMDQALAVTTIPIKNSFSKG